MPIHATSYFRPICAPARSAPTIKTVFLLVMQREVFGCFRLIFLALGANHYFSSVDATGGCVIIPNMRS